MDDRDVQQRAKWVAKWRASGLAAREFAERHGLKASQLYSWSRPTPASARGSAAAFAEVRVRESTVAFTAEPCDVAPIELVIGRVTVRVRAGVDLEFLSAVIGVVSRC